MISSYTNIENGFIFSIPLIYKETLDTNSLLTEIEIEKVSKLNTFELIAAFSNFYYKKEIDFLFININNFEIYRLFWQKVSKFYFENEIERIEQFLDFHSKPQNLKGFIVKVKLALNYIFDNGYSNQTIDQLKIKAIIEKWLKEKSDLISLPFLNENIKLENNFHWITIWNIRLFQFYFQNKKIDNSQNQTQLISLKEILKNDLLNEIIKSQIYYDSKLDKNHADFITNFEKYIKNNHGIIDQKRNSNSYLSSDGAENDGNTLGFHFVPSRNVEISEYIPMVKPAQAELQIIKPPKYATAKVIMATIEFIEQDIKNKFTPNSLTP